MQRVLVLGATGYVGSHVLRELGRRTDIEVRVSTTAPHRRLGVHTVRADVTDLDSVRSACLGMDAVISAAHAIRGSAEWQRSVNVSGGINLARAAHECGVSRVVRLGTAASYGPRYTALGGDLNTVAPTSETSRTRAEGDAAILDAGWTVVRPHLVHGETDPWVLPRIRQIFSRIGWIEQGAAQHSAISVEALASSLVDLTLQSFPAGVCVPEEEVLSVRNLLLRYDPSLDRHARASVSVETAKRSGPTGDPAWERDVAFMSRHTVLDTAGLSAFPAANGRVHAYFAAGAETS